MEKKQPLCKSIIDENIRLVETDKPLTASLRELNISCEFRKAYNKYYKFKDTNKEKKCVTCGKMFIVSGVGCGRKINCSKECIKKHHNLVMKVYYNSDKCKAIRKAYYNSDAYKKSHRTYYLKNRIKILERHKHWRKIKEKNIQK